MKYLVVIYLFVCVLVGASADALNSTAQQEWGHLLESIELLMAFSFIFLFKLITWRGFLLALGTYVCFRVAGFDYIYNLVANNEWSYVGGSNWWDQLLSNWEPGGLLFGRIIFLGVGISFPIKYLC